MITLIAAALAAAAPAASPADAHAQHQQHQQTPAAPAEHKVDCKCCDKSEGGEMKDCCEKHAGEHAHNGSVTSH